MLDCIKRTDKNYQYPWIVFDADEKEIGIGATCEQAWTNAAINLNEKLWTLKQKINEIDL